MLCNEVKELLYEYIYEELSESDKIKIEEHLLICDSCRKEYDVLKSLLIDDMSEWSDVKEQIKMPDELSLKLKAKLNKSRTLSLPRLGAAACLLIILFYTIPVAAYYIVENTSLNKYLTFDKGLVKYVEEGKVQVVEESSTMKNITFRVDGIIRKSDRTTILYTVKVPKDGEIDYALTSSAFNTVTVQDQFGYKYQSMGGAITVESANEDGEATGIMDFEPLKDWAYKLNIRVTALKGGKLIPLTEEEIKEQGPNIMFQYEMQKEKNIYGKWEVNFFINRSFK
jgi:hypothetical protein